MPDVLYDAECVQAMQQAGVESEVRVYLREGNLPRGLLPLQGEGDRKEKG